MGFLGDEEVYEVFGEGVGDGSIWPDLGCYVGEEEVLFLGADVSCGGGEGVEDGFCNAFDGGDVVGKDGAFFLKGFYCGVCQVGVFEDEPGSKGVGFGKGGVFVEGSGEGIHM